MANIYVFFADGLEEIEATAPVDLLRRAGNRVTTVSIMGRPEVRGAHDIFLRADQVFEEVDFSEGDLFLLPGGGEGTQNLQGHAPLRALLAEKQASGLPMAAICAAPSVLADLGFLQGKDATIYPGMEDQLGGGRYQDVPVVTDGQITTGHGPGAAIDFGLELVRILNGEEIRDQVKEQLVYPY